MEWFALLIPIAFAFIGIFLFKRSLTWWELPIPILICAGLILGTKSCVKSTVVTDEEYWGSLVVEARYYEYWETWVNKTCSYETCNGYDKDGNCTGYTTHYYDCSYCDHNDAYWMAYDDAGNSWSISEQQYKRLVKKWNATPQFVEMNRDIDTRGSCGQDGDMYRIRWDGKIESSEAAVTIHNYTNKVQASHSAFKLPHISKEEAKKLGLYDYPKFYDRYKQKVVLGMDSVYNKYTIDYVEQRFQYFNGYYGTRNKVKLFVLLFYDKDISISNKQQAYWDGSNQNELVICIGLNKQTKEIQWVRPFSWTNQKRVLVDCREDIAELKYFYPVRIYQVIEAAIINNIMYKDFQKDFNYLEVDLPTWAMWVIYIVTLFASIGINTMLILNEAENYNEQNSVQTALACLIIIPILFIKKIKDVINKIPFRKTSKERIV